MTSAGVSPAGGEGVGQGDPARAVPRLGLLVGVAEPGVQQEDAGRRAHGVGMHGLDARLPGAGLLGGADEGAEVEPAYVVDPHRPRLGAGVPDGFSRDRAGLRPSDLSDPQVVGVRETGAARDPQSDDHDRRHQHQRRQRVDRRCDPEAHRGVEHDRPGVGGAVGERRAARSRRTRT